MYDDAEMNIEGLPVRGIDRKGGVSQFGIAGASDEYIRCSPAKHAEFVARFRRKCGINVEPLPQPEPTPFEKQKTKLLAIYVVGCILCSIFGGIIGWTLHGQFR